MIVENLPAADMFDIRSTFFSYALYLPLFEQRCRKINAFGVRRSARFNVADTCHVCSKNQEVLKYLLYTLLDQLACSNLTV